MATLLNQQLLTDGTKHTIVKYVGTVDSNVSNTVLIDAGSLAYAQNVNNKIMGTSTDRKNFYGLGIKRIFGQAQIKSGGVVTLGWQGRPANNANLTILTIGNGPFDFNLEGQGTVGMINCPDSANCSGNIVISTAGMVASDSITLFIDAKKTAGYDQGQTARPSDFNRPGIS